MGNNPLHLVFAADGSFNAALAKGERCSASRGWSKGLCLLVYGEHVDAKNLFTLFAAAERKGNEN